MAFHRFKFATPETMDRLGASTQAIPEGNPLTIVLNNLSVTILPNNIVFSQYMRLFPSNQTMQLRNPLSESQHSLHPLMTVLFVLLKLVFVALPSGTVWVGVPSPSVVSGVVNCVIASQSSATVQKIF